MNKAIKMKILFELPLIKRMYIECRASTHLLLKTDGQACHKFLVKRMYIEYRASTHLLLRHRWTGVS